jgi:hypothetical protein
VASAGLQPHGPSAETRTAGNSAQVEILPGAWLSERNCPGELMPAFSKVVALANQLRCSLRSSSEASMLVTAVEHTLLGRLFADLRKLPGNGSVSSFVGHVLSGPDKLNAENDTRPIEALPIVPSFPSELVVAGAGTLSCNGVYRWAGSINDKPLWLHEDGSERAVWYFETVGASLWFSGWYISKRPGTSWVSASEDYYCLYDSDQPGRRPLEAPLVQTEWVVRDASGVLGLLAGGIGRAPGPHVTGRGEMIPMSRLARLDNGSPLLSSAVETVSEIVVKVSQRNVRFSCVFFAHATSQHSEA